MYKFALKYAEKKAKNFKNRNQSESFKKEL